MGFRAFHVAALFLGAFSAAAQGGGVGPCDPDGIQSSGARYRICMPPDTPYNGDLVIYCHGYVEPGGPPEVPEDEFCFGGLCVYEIFHAMGYAFAATSYATHGVAVREGVDDVVELVDIFAEFYGQPNRVYLVGFSEGAQIATLLAERRPDLVTAAVAACGPIGDWRMQINYLGDFRLIFDAFFPGLIPGEPLDIDPEFIEGWDEYWETVVWPELLKPGNRWKVRELLRIANAPAQPLRYRGTVAATVHDILWFNIVGTNDVVEKLGGQPFDNTQRVYKRPLVGPDVDKVVPRFAADAEALAVIDAEFETSGALEVPVVVLHNLLDYQVPYWHVARYQLKLVANDSEDMATFIAVPAYGHCSFTPLEVTAAFAIAVRRATGEFPSGLANIADDPEKREELVDLLREYANQHLLRRGW